MALESEINRLKGKIEMANRTNSDNWVYIEIHEFLMLFELTAVAALCLIFYFTFRRISSSLPRHNVPTSQEDRIQLLSDESKLIAQSCTQNKVGQSDCVRFSLINVYVSFFPTEISLPF